MSVLQFARASMAAKEEKQALKNRRKPEDYWLGSGDSQLSVSEPYNYPQGRITDASDQF